MNADNEILLGVNIDHVATLRQSRGTRYPDPVQAAIEVEQAGADAVTLHLREDRRHIQERDVRAIRDTVLTRMNLEMAVTDEMLALAEEIRPHDCCLVPERREELTTEGGLDVAGQLSRMKDACDRLRNAGVRVSLFIDADADQVEAAREVGAPVIEIHTGHFADASDEATRQQEYRRIVDAVKRGNEAGLQVNAGHGLNYQNVREIARLKSIRELNIGHAIIARALFTGLQQAVADMRRLMMEGRSLL
jgi:pyridoxine 5-phosphate synthase